MKGFDEVITVKAPGKLYVAGEYAVVKSGYPAIVVAVNQFVTVSINKAKNHGTINSKQYEEVPIVWQRRGDKLVIDNRDNPFEYILSAIKYTEMYAVEHGNKLKLYNLNVNSQLDAKDGKKYGLGSSAAVTVATVKALSAFYKLDLTKEEIFKLASISHFKVQNNGSFGDIAASVYGGWIAYQAPDRDWLNEMLDSQSLSDVIAMNWPDLHIENLDFPNELELLIGWTGKPASTPVLVDKIAVAQAKQHDKYNQFLDASKKCVNKLIKGFKTGSTEVIKKQIMKNRLILQKLADFSGVSIETRKLTNLCNIAIKHGAAAKTSGAGGGDCGIAIADSNQHIKSNLLKEWNENGIKPLDFDVHFLNE